MKTKEFKKLFKILTNYVEDSISYDELQREFYDYYVDDLAEEVLSKQEENLFSHIQEKMDWVTGNPDRESREYGWISIDEFKQWLTKKMTERGQSEVKLS
jgi:Lhr-like helicase